MKRRSLLRYLKRRGYRVLRDTGPHTIVIRDANGRKTAVPRHTEIKRGTVRQICKDLDIAEPSTD